MFFSASSAEIYRCTSVTCLEQVSNWIGLQITLRCVALKYMELIPYWKKMLRVVYQRRILPDQLVRKTFGYVFFLIWTNKGDIRLGRFLDRLMTLEDNTLAATVLHFV